MPAKNDYKTERLLTNRLHGGSELLGRDFARQTFFRFKPTSFEKKRIGAKESVHLKPELTLLISNYLFQIIYFIK